MERSNKRNSKRGSSAVFLMVILGALISIVMALIYGVRAESTRSRADAIINLAGDSVLSEFDYHVQKEYGLFLIRGTDEELSKKLRNYISYSLDEMDDVTIERVKASAGSFSIVNTELVKKQILEHMRYAETAGLLEQAVSGGDKDAAGIDETGNVMENRTLKHGPTIVSLPSARVPAAGLTTSARAIAEKAGQVEQAFSSGTENYLLNRYILMHFNSKDHGDHVAHFFKNEVEYILAGELSDLKNEKRVEMALKALRFPLNLAHIYADPDKRTAVVALAELMTPGAAAAATQAALASTWAYVESDNDVELLWQGDRVPMVKDASSWAVDLDSAVEGVFGGTIRPEAEKGYDYDQYLQILLFFRDENVKLARILDLIQINERKNHNEGFLIQEYGAGITVHVTVNGKDYKYEKKY